MAEERGRGLQDAGQLKDRERCIYDVYMSTRKGAGPRPQVYKRHPSPDLCCGDRLPPQWPAIGAWPARSQ